MVIQRAGVLPELARLAILVDAFGGCLPDGGNELDAVVLLTTFGRIYDCELPGLRRVVTAENRQHLLRAGDAARMRDGGGEPGIVAVELRLPRAVRIHLEQRLHEDLAPVVVVPARVDDAAIIENLRVNGVDLVEAETTEVAAFGVAGVEIANLSPPAVHGLDAAAGSEDEVTVGKVGRLVIGEAKTGGHLADLVGGDVQFINMVVVFVEGFLPGKQNAPAIPRNGGVADCASGIGNQGADFAVSSVHFEQTEFGAGAEVPFLLCVGEALSVGEEGGTDGAVFGEDDAR